MPLDPRGRTTCGGGQSADALACGNQRTQFIGFTYNQPTVARMLGVVGDDDSCDDPAANCDCHAEHLSFIGPQLGVYDTGSIHVTKSVVGVNATTPSEFTLTATNGCSLPETPFV